MSNDSKRKYKKPKQNTTGTTNPQASKKTNKKEKENAIQPRCPLLAKDSEWLDRLQSTSVDSSGMADNVTDEEEVLQLVECEDGPEMKPLTIMFPGLLEKDPQTLQDMLNKRMSTTEMTRHLLGQKADFSLMKKVTRLIPGDKKWLQSLSEDSNSNSSEIQHGSTANRSDGCEGSVESNSNIIKSSTTDVTGYGPHTSTSEI